MKKSVVNAAMLLALGVSGVANAVQMHGVIKGKVTNGSVDGGSAKAWDKLAVNDNIQIDFWLDSEIVPVAHYHEPQDNHLFKSENYSSAGPSAITVTATINGMSRQITSNLSWSLHDYFLVNSNPDHFVFGVGEWKAVTTVDSRNAAVDLSFADGSTPVLRELLMGHALTIVPSGGSGQFIYQGSVNGNTYNSRVYYSANSFSITPVPEPETWAMMLLGLGVVGYAAHRRAAR